LLLVPSQVLNLGSNTIADHQAPTADSSLHSTYMYILWLLTTDRRDRRHEWEKWWQWR